MNRGMNGHWVSTRTPEGAKAFMDGQRLDQERRDRADELARARRADALARIRSLWRMLRRR